MENEVLHLILSKLDNIQTDVNELKERQGKLEQRFDKLEQHQLRTEVLIETELIPNINLALENHGEFSKSLKRVEDKVDCLSETVALHTLQINSLTNQQMG